MKSILLVVAMTVPAATAFACPGKATANADDSTEKATHADADATRCAKNADLVGTNCSYSTGMMAQRVQADGQEISLTAKLERTSENLPSKVATPFMASDYHVIANEIVDGLDAAKKHNLTGKTLEIDGVKYFLVTGFEPVSS